MTTLLNVGLTRVCKPAMNEAASTSSLIALNSKYYSSFNMLEYVYYQMSREESLKFNEASF